MATVRETSGQEAAHQPHAEHPKAGEFINKDEAKKAVNKASGRPDAEGKNPALTENQLTRAASEYMVALRPQPDKEQMATVLKAIIEKDDKGILKHKCKNTDDVPAIVDTLLTEKSHGSAHT